MNRVGAGRLCEIARILDVRVSIFFEGDDDGVGEEQAEFFGFLRSDGAIDLLRAFNALEDDQMRSDVVTLVPRVARLGQEQNT
ncbi:hypothetical protein J2W79_003903 [Methylorubrum extorquens]|nr:hypothetical protein [Methylorubrum extorquens]